MRLLLPLLFLSLFLFAGCDSGDDDGGDLALGSMTARVDGTAWNAANATVTEVTVAGNRTLTINGASIGASVSTMSVSVTRVGGTALGTGTYAIGDDGTDSVFGTGAYASAPGTNYFATSGTLTITAIDDDHMEGSFSFTASQPSSSETVTVADGRFNVGFGPPIAP